MSGLTTKSTLSASATPFSPPSSFSVSANAPVFVPQRTRLNPCAAEFDISKLGTTPAVEQSPVVLHVESSPQPSLSKPFSEPHKLEPQKPEPQKSDHKSEPEKTEPQKPEPKLEQLSKLEPSKTEHKENKTDSKTDSSKTDIHKDTHKPEPALPSTIKPDKFVYTRQELLDFRNRPECQEPPSGADWAGLGIASSELGKNKQQPGWRGAKKPAVSNNNSSVRGRGREGVRGKKDAPLDIEVIPLQMTENRYIVKTFEGEEKLLRVLQGILNKLTPESFDSLLQQVLNLGIESVGLLEKAVSAFFEKALSEPTFSPVYAEFCEKLSEKLPPVLDETTGKPKKFKSLLLNQCQREFEKQDRKDESGNELDDDAKKKRQLGTIRFIGELFIRGLLKTDIMFDCFRVLAENPSEENIEALCKLMRTVGKTLDQSAPAKLTPWFETLKEMSTNENLNFRFRFMLQDVIDLRREKWVGRIETLKAKKLSDVHKQDEEDKKRKERQEWAQQKQAEDARRAAPSNRKGDRYTNLRSPQKAASSQSLPPDDGFTTQTQKKGKRLNKPEIRPVAKPGREEARVAKNKVKKPDAEEAKKPTQPSGFGVLDLSDDGGDIEQPEEVDESEAMDNDNADAENAENDNNAESEDPESREEALKSIERLLCDFLRCSDMKEAIDCIEELKTTQYHSDIVDKGVNLLFDTKEENGAMLVKLFRQLAADGILTQRHFEAGLAPTLEILDDLILDFPRAIPQLASFVAPLFVDSILPLSLFSSEAAANLKGSGSLGKWFDLTLKQIRTMDKDDEFIKKLVQDSKLNIVVLFKSPAQLETFLKDHEELKSLAA